MRANGTVGAIILGGNSIALGIARSLGSQGIPVWVYDSVRSIAHFSRFTTRAIVASAASTEFLLAEGRKYHLRDWLLFPVSDSAVEFLAANHEALGSVFKVTAPPAPVARFALDKRLTYKRADALGIATPWTRIVQSPVELNTLNAPFPLILKPAINHHFVPLTNVKALPVESAADLPEKFAEMNRTIPAEEILIQERIPGGGEHQFSCAALCEAGRTRAKLVVRRTRQYPLDFGNASSFVETVDQPVVEADGLKWLESVGFDGMAEVEFKLDPRDGRYKLLDVNIRAWGWHTLGKAVGIDFSYLLWRQKLGLPLLPMRPPRRAAYCRELNDLIAISQSSHRVREFKRLLRALYAGAFTLGTFDLWDPIPLFAEFGLRAVEVLENRRKKRMHRRTLSNKAAGVAATIL